MDLCVARGRAGDKENRHAKGYIVVVLASVELVASPSSVAEKKNEKENNNRLNGNACFCLRCYQSFFSMDT